MNSTPAVNPVDVVFQSVLKLLLLELKFKNCKYFLYSLKDILPDVARIPDDALNSTCGFVWLCIAPPPSVILTISGGIPKQLDNALTEFSVPFDLYI